MLVEISICRSVITHYAAHVVNIMTRLFHSRYALQYVLMCLVVIMLASGNDLLNKVRSDVAVTAKEFIFSGFRGSRLPLSIEGEASNASNGKSLTPLPISPYVPQSQKKFTLDLESASERNAVPAAQVSSEDRQHPSYASSYSMYGSYGALQKAPHSTRPSSANYQTSLFLHLGGYRGYVLPPSVYHMSPSQVVYEAAAPVDPARPAAVTVIQQPQPQPSHIYYQYVPYLAPVAPESSAPTVFHSVANPAYTAKVAQRIQASDHEATTTQNPLRGPVDFVRYLMQRYPSQGVSLSQSFAGYPLSLLVSQCVTERPLRDSLCDIVSAPQKKSDSGRKPRQNSGL